MYVCMYVCMCVCMCVNVYVCMHIPEICVIYIDTIALNANDQSMNIHYSKLTTYR